MNGTEGKLSSPTVDRFFSLERGSERQLIRGIEKPHSRAVATETMSIKADFSGPAVMTDNREISQNMKIKQRKSKL